MLQCQLLAINTSLLFFLGNFLVHQKKNCDGGVKSIGQLSSSIWSFGHLEASPFKIGSREFHHRAKAQPAGRRGERNTHQLTKPQSYASSSRPKPKRPWRRRRSRRSGWAAWRRRSPSPGTSASRPLPRRLPSLLLDLLLPSPITFVSSPLFREIRTSRSHCCSF